MTLEIYALDAEAPIPRQTVLALTCDLCGRRETEVGHWFPTQRSAFTKRGWIERADGNFDCTRCSQPSQMELL